MNILSDVPKYLVNDSIELKNISQKIDKIDREIYGDDIDNTEVSFSWKNKQNMLVLIKDIRRNGKLIYSYRIELGDSVDCYDPSHIDSIKAISDELLAIKKYCDSYSADIHSWVDKKIQLNTTDGDAEISFTEINNNSVAIIKSDNLVIAYDIKSSSIIKVIPDTISYELVMKKLTNIDVINYKVMNNNEKDNQQIQKKSYKYKINTEVNQNLEEYPSINIQGVTITYNPDKGSIIKVEPDIISEEEAIALLTRLEVWESKKSHKR